MRRRNRQTYMMAARYAAAAIVAASVATLAFDWLRLGIQDVMTSAPLAGVLAMLLVENPGARRLAPFPVTEDERDGVSELLNALWLGVYICIAIDPKLAATAFFAVAGVHLELTRTYKRNRKTTGLDVVQPIPQSGARRS